MSKNSKRKRRRAGQNQPQKQQAGARKSRKLELWQERLRQSDMEWSPLVSRMDHREELYNGEEKLKPMIEGDNPCEKTPHVRNIIFENIESKVSSSIPQPKVTAVRQQDEQLAEIIENHLRNELNRMESERNNDMAERTVPIQGGVLWLTEWNEGKKGFNSKGELEVSLIHPKQLAPQPGIYTGLKDMDWVIIKKPTTKATIKRVYDIDVRSETESEPELRSVHGTAINDEALTQYIGFERNQDGGIDRYSWVNDVELEDLTNYQARRQPVCSRCGRVRPLQGQVISNNVLHSDLEAMDAHSQAQQMMAGHEMAQSMAGSMMMPDEGEDAFLSGIEMEQGTAPGIEYDGGACPWCGCEDWETREMEYEQIILPIKTAAGHEIPGEHFENNADDVAVMVPTLVPFYKPDCLPLVLQVSVSVFGQLLGNSDVDVIEDQQNTTNRIEKKIIDRLLKAGTRVTLPADSKFRIDQKDFEKWYVPNQATKNQIGVYEFSGNLQYELTYLSQVYEEARQILGITDSFQGRRDATATSGKAKEYSAAQAAGRMESQRVMKQAAYAQMFEVWFKFLLAYADEPRPVTYKDFKGKAVYKEFNRYDFLEQDENGQWHWNDRFLFSCDTSAPLANNREAMWQETRMNLETGAFGDPTKTETLILFWGKMELLHYPGAGETKKYLEDRLAREQAQQMQMMQMQAAQAQGMMPGMMQNPAVAGNKVSAAM